MKVAILTSPNQWFVPFAEKLNQKIKDSELYFNHKEISESFDVVFILGYHKIIDENSLKQHKNNIVIHESALPHGKGWAPLFWQILEGKNEIPFTMFEASLGVDDGDIYMQRTLELTGFELNAELREKQANFTIEMCSEFLNNYEKYKIPKKQTGEESFYKKRTSKESELDIHKTIKEQFNLLRIVDNENYPAFFEIDGNRYILKIELDKWGVELVDFVDLSLDEKKMVLNWRNDESIKKWMYSQDAIILENHLQYIDTLEASKTKQYMAVKMLDKYIGVIYCTNINFQTKTTDFGLYANPFEKVAGVGRILEECCIKYAFEMLKIDKMMLEVFSDNVQVINLHKKYNFQEVSKKEINNKEVICMELRNEKY